ncbi:MAG: glycosyltransferase family 2 protein [Acidimicrobiales bacterium]
MSPAAPPVSVGLPVRNGMPYIVECLDSIREQSFGDFELLICDNASTDGTEEVSRELARADSRVRYLRVDSDSGASANFNRCFAGTTGALFTWVASDDRFLPRYLEQTVNHLREHAEYAMCIPAVRFIDEASVASDVVFQPVALSSPLLKLRLKSYLDRRSWFMVYGLVRREALETTGLFPQRFGPDVILVWEVLLRFRVGTLPETLLEYRRYRVKEAEVVWRGLQPEGAGRAPGWLHLGLFKDLLESCDRDGVDPAARVAGRRALFRWLASTPFRDLVVDDLRDELRRTSRAKNPVYDAALLASMALLRPGRAIRNARRQPIMQILGQGGGRRRSSAP